MKLNLRQQSVGETTCLVLDMEDTVEIDSFAMQMMAHNRMINIVPVQIVRMNERRQVQFNVTGLIKLNNRISTPRPKKEVLEILNSILNIFDEVDAYMLDMGHLFLDWEYIYLDGKGNCMLMYLPFDHEFNKDKIDFLQEIVSRIPQDYQEKDPYLFDILNSFSRGAIRKIADLREIIKKNSKVLEEECGEEEKMPEPVYEDRDRGLQREASTVQKGAEKKLNKKTVSAARIPVVNIPRKDSGVKDDLAVTGQASVREEIVTEKKEKKGFFRKAAKEKNKFSIFPKTGEEAAAFREGGIPANVPETVSRYEKGRQNNMYESYEHTVIMQDPVSIQGDSGETVMLEQEEFFALPTARLMRKKDGAIYQIRKDKILVGSGAAADICIYNNNAVSRSHAVILYENGDYYVEDCQSKNGSFLNGRRLQAGVKEFLYDGMVLRLANEEFEFSKG